MFKGPEAQASVPGHGKVWASRPVGQPLPSAHPFLCCQNLSLTTQGWGMPSPLCPCTRVGILRTFMPSHLCAYLYWRVLSLHTGPDTVWECGDMLRRDECGVRRLHVCLAIALCVPACWHNYLIRVCMS